MQFRMTDEEFGDRMIKILKVECVQSHAVRRVGDEAAVELRAVEIVLDVFDCKCYVVCNSCVSCISLCYGDHLGIDIRSDDGVLFL